MKRMIAFVLFIGSGLWVMSPHALGLATKPVKKILIIIALDKEASYVIKALNLRQTPPLFAPLPMQSYRGSYANVPILMIVSGIDPIYKAPNVGSEPAVLSTYLGIKYFQPDLVINVGIAGGSKKNGAQINHIYLSEKIYFFDRRMQTPSHQKYGLGGYQSDITRNLMRGTKLTAGNLCTGGSFQLSKTDYKVIIDLDCKTVDMEAAGIAWVSMLMKTPMFAIKGVTDFVEDKNNHQELRKNFSLVGSSLVIYLKKAILSLNH